MDTDVGFILKKLGLTKTEISVYKIILQMKNTSIGSIIKISNLHRGTVYNTLQRLIQKGLVYKEVEGKNIGYHISPQGFLSDLVEETQTIEEKHRLVKEITKRIKLAKTVSKKPSKQIKILQGQASFKNFFLDLLYQSRRNEEPYKFVGDGGDMGDVIGMPYYKFSQEQKIKLGTKCKVILNESKKEHVFQEFVAGNIKWVPPDYDFSGQDFWIYDNKIVTVNWRQKPLQIEISEDKDILKWHSSIFKVFWKAIALKRDEYLKSNIWKKTFPNKYLTLFWLLF